MLENESDIEELDRTTFIIGPSTARAVLALLVNFALCLFRAPKCFTTYVAVCRAAGGGWLKHFFYFLEACWLYHFCERHAIDHVHAHFGTNPAEVAMYARILGGATYSFTLHGPEEFDAPQQFSLGLKIHHAKRVVAITSFCRSQLYRWSKVEDWPKVTEVHCSIDDKMLRPAYGAPVHPKALINIGRLCGQKGQMLLLSTFKRVVDAVPSAKLHLVGDGELRPMLEAFCDQHQLQNAVIFEGWCSGDRIKDLLDQCAGLVLPSFAEGLPVALMEAFARRRTVITTYIAGIPELVHSDNGWLVPAGDEDTLYDAIMALLNASPEQLERKGNNGFAAVVERHKDSVEAQKLLDALGFSFNAVN